jgi:hypothetical protein
MPVSNSTRPGLPPQPVMAHPCDEDATDVASPTRSTGASEKHTHHDQNEDRNPDQQHDATRAFYRRSYMTKGLLADRSGEPVIHSTSRWSALKAAAPRSWLGHRRPTISLSLAM